jgi:hypothetical protein
MENRSFEAVKMAAIKCSASTARSGDDYQRLANWASGACRALGITFCRPEAGLILFRYSDEEAQRFINRFGIWKRFSYIRLESNYVAEPFATRPQFPHT